jgi:hypothetical protein
MSASPSWRTVRLFDGRGPGHPIVAAELHRNYPVAGLDRIEAAWSATREQLAPSAPDSAEHTHWDWRNKADSVAAGHHLLVAVECAGEVQGLMAVLRTPRSARLGEGTVIYVDYVESAPWNLKRFVPIPRFLGIGTALLADAVRLSFETGLEGRVGLHSLPQAESFYRERCRMQEVGPDPAYYDLTYFEFTGQQAAAWLDSMGESL